MDAMSYETLICAAHNCRRGGVAGADTRFYNDLEMAEQRLTEKHWLKPQYQKESDFVGAFVIVRHHVRVALREGLRKIESRATPQDIAKCEEIRVKLRSLPFLDKSELDKIIDTAVEIFYRNGLRLS